MADVTVVGAGVSGLTAAIELAGRGAKVRVVEKEPRAGAEGSSRAQGSLRVQGRHAAEFSLAHAALTMWTALAKEALDDGQDLKFDIAGNAYIATTDNEVSLLNGIAVTANASGLRDVRVLTPSAAQKAIPGISDRFKAALFSPVDAACDPPAVMQFLAAKAARMGVDITYCETAREITTAGGFVSGVRTDQAHLPSSRVLLAAGVWTPHLASTVGVEILVMPVELGERRIRAAQPAFAPTIRGINFGARPQNDGRMVISGGLNARIGHSVTLYDFDHVGMWSKRLLKHWRKVRFRLGIRDSVRQLRAGGTRNPGLIGSLPERDPAERALNTAVERIVELFPTLAGQQLVTESSWIGHIDLTPDGLPIIDANAGPGGLVVIAGLSGHGLATAPAVGQVAADLCEEKAPAFDLTPFRNARFSEPGLEFPATIL